MSYVTLLQLAELPGALELSQVATDRHAAGIVDAQLMELTLTDGDRSAYSADDIAAADQARARIVQASGESDALIDGYIGKRYRLPLPLTQIPTILTTWARAITRYKLHGERISSEPSDPIVRDYKDALRFLQQVAEGKFSLGIEDPEAQGNGPGEVRIDPGLKVFGREHLP
jgi:phage gp36-like protein